MIINWDGCDEGDPVADGMAAAGELNLGLPFALVLMAVTRAEARVKATGVHGDYIDRATLLAELRGLLDQWHAEGADNA